MPEIEKAILPPMRESSNKFSGCLSAGEQTQTRGDFIDALTNWVSVSQPYSWRSAATALIALLLASLLRASFGSIGSHFPLTLYFPAILAVGVLAGLPAAYATAITSVVIVWWAFIPPYMEFAWPKAEDFAVWLLFIVASAITILIGWLCRLALVRLHRHQVAYQTVAQELQHRKKNALAVTEVVVKRTLKHDRGAANAIMGRLRSIEYCNDRLADPLVRCGTLKGIVDNECGPFGQDRYVTHGRPVEVPAQTIRSLTMIFHELVTNAVKYGALSNGSGRILIDWEINEAKIVLRWHEEGGPPVKLPLKSGFGTALMARCIRDLSGEMQLKFPREGVYCSLAFALPESQLSKRAA